MSNENSRRKVAILNSTGCSEKQTSANKIKVLCVVDYYLPGFNGGGPIRTIANMRSLLAGKVDIAIFTRDRDLGSSESYASVQSDTWVEEENGPIYYASKSMFDYDGLKKAISTSNYDFDILYLNSFFGFRSSIQVCLWFQYSFPHTPILLAPRGEFSAGALAIKSLKKRLFLFLSRSLNLYRTVSWHASTDAERDDILRQFPSAKGRIYVAEDPISVKVDFDGVAGSSFVSPKGFLRLAFISRISPMKNLDGLLRILGMIECQIDLDIFGPIEDVSYWRNCQSLIAILPQNVRASYKGALHPEKVSRVFADYDLFAFPTHGENFGHVIFEALRAGTPVLISDQTSWKADTSGAVTVIPMTEIGRWREQLQAVGNRTEAEKLKLRSAARLYAEEFAHKSEILAKNLSMFRHAAKRDPSEKVEPKPGNSCD